MKVAANSKSMRGRTSYWPFGRILLPLLLLVPGVSQGQDESFSIDSWGTRNGLPEMAVQALAVEPTGGLFVGTAGGLCLFDGSYCKPLQNREMSKFPTSNLTTLLRERSEERRVGKECR